MYITSPEIETYCESNCKDELPVLRQITRNTYLQHHQPQMLSGRLQGEFLQLMSKLLKPGRILEIGTFTGYSAVCLAQGLQSGGELHTIEINPELAELAMQNVKEANLDSKITIHTGDALEIIPTFAQPFDLVFMDAAKDNYIELYELVIKKIKPGGLLLADNTLWYGHVVEEKETSKKDTAAILAFNEYVRQDSRIENVLLPLRDGLTLIRIC